MVVTSTDTERAVCVVSADAVGLAGLGGTCLFAEAVDCATGEAIQIVGLVFDRVVGTIATGTVQRVQCRSSEAEVLGGGVSIADIVQDVGLTTQGHGTETAGQTNDCSTAEQHAALS